MVYKAKRKMKERRRKKERKREKEKNKEKDEFWNRERFRSALQNTGKKARNKLQGNQTQSTRDEF